MTFKIVHLHDSPSILIERFVKNKEYTKLALLVDSNTKICCYPLIKDSLPNHNLIQLPAGESYKNLTSCQHIWEQLTELNFDRHSLLIVLGGGVLGDMGGFCAATFKRGIEFVLIPTTLLAQVDASIGGKLGIDFKHFKNHIGLFKNPLVTLISPAFLSTLPERELRSGFAEIIKHCLIADKAMWEIIRQKPLEGQDWKTLIPHSIKIKQAITDQDPSEKGLRKALNFGHTLGHAVETYYLSTANPIFHGEAIAMGMIMESFIAMKRGYLTEPELNSIKDYLILIFGKVETSFEDEAIQHLTLQDKKNKGDQVLLAVPKGIGQSVWDVMVNQLETREAMNYYRSL